ELRDAGYTAVGEFHYLGLAEAHAAAGAAAEAGVELVLLYSAYARGGIERFRQASVGEYLRGLEELRDAGIRVGVAPHSVRACPTTEANLGDGFLPVERLLHRGIGMCIGSDSNARIDPLEELRELDGIARRQAGRRDVLTVDALLSIGSDEGAASLGLAEWPA